MNPANKPYEVEKMTELMKTPVNYSPIIFNPRTRTLSVAVKWTKRFEDQCDLVIKFEDDGDFSLQTFDRAANPDRWGEEPEYGSGTALECIVIDPVQAAQMLRDTGFKLDLQEIDHAGQPQEG